MKDKIYHIVTTGGYGYNDVGDEAMPRTLLMNLKARFNNKISVTMLSPKPHFTEQYHGEAAAPDLVFMSQSQETMNAERTLILDLAKRFFKHPRWTRFLITKALSAADRKWYVQTLDLLELLKSADALVNVGGGNLNSIMAKELYKKTTLYEICRIFKKPVFVSGQSLGPFYNDNDKAIARESLSKVDALTFRDKGFSFKRIESIGLVKKNYNELPVMYDAGDDAMSMPQESEEKIRFFFKTDTPEQWFTYNAKQVWALNLKASLNSFKGKGRSTDLDAEVNLLAEVSEYILRKYSSKILLVPTDYCEGVDDRVYHNQIITKISPDLKHRIFSMEKVYTDFELKGIISACDFALGARYHFSVFSLSARVPSIGIASGEYQQAKLNGIYSLLDLQEYYIPQDMEYAKIEDVATVVDRLVKRRDEVEKKLEKNVGPLIDNSRKIVDIIHDRLTTGLIDEAACNHPENEIINSTPELEEQKGSVAEIRKVTGIKVSVIIPTLNHSSSLRIALQSVIEQDFPSTGFEILVVDNGSTDDTRPVTEKAAMENPGHCIRYIREPIPGLLSGRHRGANEAAGNILAFIDDDIEADTGWLSAIMDAFEDSSVQLVGGPSLPRYEVTPPNWITRYIQKRQDKMICGSLSLLDIGTETIKIDPTYVWGLNFSIRKETLFKIGGFNPDGVPKNMLHFRGDGETGLALKMRNRQMAAIYTPRAKVYHHIPKERLTVQYFENRFYSQGISDSYTQIRKNNGLNKVVPPDLNQGEGQKMAATIYDGYKEMAYRRIENAYVKGFRFHYNAVKNSEKLMAWVLRENYFDYSLPEIV